jgi:hypothetical protein
MEKSESIKEIAAALADFHDKVEKVTKDATNPFFKSKYASLENVIETIEAPLGQCGLSWAQFPDGDGLYTLITHKSGEWIGAHASLELKGHTPQDQGSAITYMRRYALSAALGLATEEDDDGNAATVAAKAKPAALPVPPKQVEDKRAAMSKLDAEKLEVQKLAQEKSGQPFFSNRAELDKYIKGATGLIYGEANNAEIIERLKAI